MTASSELAKSVLATLSTASALPAAADALLSAAAAAPPVEPPSLEPVAAPAASVGPTLSSSSRSESLSSPARTRADIPCELGRQAAGIAKRAKPRPGPIGGRRAAGRSCRIQPSAAAREASEGRCKCPATHRKRCGLLPTLVGTARRRRHRVRVHGASLHPPSARLHTQLAWQRRGPTSPGSGCDRATRPAR